MMRYRLFIETEDKDSSLYIQIYTIKHYKLI